jgi:hypothetical protein
MDRPVFNDSSLLDKLRICLRVAFVIITVLAAVQIYNRVRHRLIIPIYSPFAPAAGMKRSVSPILLDVSTLAAKHNLRQLSLSKELLAKAEGSPQEFLYPIRIIPNSDYIFALPHENIPNRNCRTDTTGEIVFYDCHIE